MGTVKQGERTPKAEMREAQGYRKVLLVFVPLRTVELSINCSTFHVQIDSEMRITSRRAGLRVKSLTHDSDIPGAGDTVKNVTDDVLDVNLRSSDIDRRFQ